MWCSAPLSRALNALERFYNGSLTNEIVTEEVVDQCEQNTGTGYQQV